MFNVAPDREQRPSKEERKVEACRQCLSVSSLDNSLVMTNTHKKRMIGEDEDRDILEELRVRETRLASEENLDGLESLAEVVKIIISNLPICWMSFKFWNSRRMNFLWRNKATRNDHSFTEYGNSYKLLEKGSKEKV